MILKFWGSYYNLDGWKKVYLEDNYMYFQFGSMSNGKDIEGEPFSEPYEIFIDLDPNDDAMDITRQHEDWDHKDERQLRYRISGKAYDRIMERILDKTEYYDLDADYPQILKDAEAELVKEFEEYEE